MTVHVLDYNHGRQMLSCRCMYRRGHVLCQAVLTLRESDVSSCSGKKPGVRGMPRWFRSGSQLSVTSCCLKGMVNGPA